MTRAEQDAILEPVARACRVVDYALGDSNAWNLHSVASFRAALRLDEPYDPELAKLPWHSLPDRARVPVSW